MTASLAGQPGFVSDDYLNSISAETTVAAFELEANGMWSRREGGYFIVADDMVSQMIDYNEEADRLVAACQARREHRADPVANETEWITCADCGIPLCSPDGEPVATDNGGPLGPDLRGDR